MLKHLLRVNAVIRNSDGGHDGELPGIEMIDFGDSQIVPFAKAIFQALHHVAFFFQRVGMLDVDFERQHSNYRLAHGLIMTARGAGRWRQGRHGLDY